MRTYSKTKDKHTYENKIPPRLGKTAKDRRTGKHARTIANRLVRVAWEQSPDRTQADFPYHVCNGKRNRVAVAPQAKTAGKKVKK